MREQKRAARHAATRRFPRNNLEREQQVPRMRSRHGTRGGPSKYPIGGITLPVNCGIFFGKSVASRAMGPANEARTRRTQGECS